MQRAKRSMFQCLVLLSLHLKKNGNNYTSRDSATKRVKTFSQVLMFATPLIFFGFNFTWDGTYEGDVLSVGSYYDLIEFNDPEGGVATGAVSITME